MAEPSVLLIRLSSLGDLVLATGALAPLRAAGCRVSLVTKKEFAPLLRDQPGIDEVFAFDKALGEEEATRALLDWVRARRFTHALDLQNSWRTWRWRSRLGVPVRVLRKPRLREWLVLFLRLGPWVGFGRGGRARRFREAASALAQELAGTLPSVTAPLTTLAGVVPEAARVEPLLPPGDFAVLLPAGAWKSKEWPYFPELARRLAGRVPVVVLGGAKDEICAEVARAAQAVRPESRSLHGQTSLRESLAVLAHPRARWVVGNDTGMVHVAEALGKDVAMIEGPTHPFMGFSPHRDGSLALGLPLVCRPCSKSGRFCVRFGTRQCLRGLGVDAVAAELRARGYPC